MFHSGRRCLGGGRGGAGAVVGLAEGAVISW
jgi:hypothetical protein